MKDFIFFILLKYEWKYFQFDRTGPSLQKIKAILKLRNNTGNGSWFIFVLLINIQKIFI